MGQVLRTGAPALQGGEEVGDINSGPPAEDVGKLRAVGV